MMIVLKSTYQTALAEADLFRIDLRQAKRALLERDQIIDGLKVEITDLHLRNAELKEKLTKAGNWTEELIQVIDEHFKTLQSRDLTSTDAGSSGSEGEVSEVSDSRSEDVHAESSGT